MNKRWQVVLIWLGGIVVIALIAMVGMKSSVERKMVEDQVDDVGISEVDVKEYYEEKSVILDTYAVQDSSNTQTELQAKEDVIQRGLDQNEITYDYSIDGDYVGNQEAKDIKNKHPMYQTLYISSMGDIWNIIIINGSVIANPVSYNMESELSAQTIISESEIIMGYDSENNTFYETIPKESELIVKVVDKIDSETLNSLTKEVIAGL